MTINLIENCPECSGRDYIPKKDKDGKYLSCEHCGGFGKSLTDDGQDVVQQLYEIYGISPIPGIVCHIEK